MSYSFVTTNVMLNIYACSPKPMGLSNRFTVLLAVHVPMTITRCVINHYSSSDSLKLKVIEVIPTAVPLKGASVLP